MNAHPARGAAARVVLRLALVACVLFLALQNTVLLMWLSPSIHWPPALAGVGTALNVVRVLLVSFMPWIAVGVGVLAVVGLATWLASRIEREVRHA